MITVLKHIEPKPNYFKSEYSGNHSKFILIYFHFKTQIMKTKFKRNPSGFWSKEKCKIEALKYNTRTVFQINNRACYQVARKQQWLNDICKHMKEIRKPKGFWNKEKCRIEALKYDTRGSFKKNNHTAYGIAWKQNWLNDICKHMVKKYNRKS